LLPPRLLGKRDMKTIWKIVVHLYFQQYSPKYNDGRMNGVNRFPLLFGVTSVERQCAMCALVCITA
jgi:hypothetical protein